jgi:sterol desaturase/sphingolipid hydroxylase (fatty acid hydroxylase superfamily)
MTNQLLLPHRYKLLGWCLLIPATVIGLYLTFSDFEGGWLRTKVFSLFNDSFFTKSNKNFSIVETDITNTLVGVVFIIGALLVGFTKEKREDEFIAGLRLSSLQWAVWVNYTVLLLAFLLVYGTAFINVMVYNMFTVLIIFIVRFNFLLYKSTKAVADEKLYQG